MNVESLSAAFKAAQDLPDNDVQLIAYVISSCIVGLTIMLFMYCCVSVKKKVARRGGGSGVAHSSTAQASSSSSTSLPRIRKRDKVASLTKKMFKKLPKAKSFHDIHKILDRRATMTLESARRFIQGPGGVPGMVRINTGPPNAALEEIMGDADHRLPAELKNILHSTRVFGNFEQPVFLELCKFVSSSFYPRGSLLNDLDSSFYVVQSGEMSVFIEDSEQKQYVIKKAYSGDSIFSLISILDTISSSTPRRTSVYARCDTDCVLLKLPNSAFGSVHSKNPESMFRFIQVILLRLSRVTYLALYKYLGLTRENVEKEIELPELQVHSLSSLRRARSGGKQKRKQRSRSNTGNSSNHSTTDEQFEEAITDPGSGGTNVVNFDIGSPVAVREEIPDDNKVIKIAMEDLAKLLDLPEPSMLEGKVTLIHIARGSVISKQGEVEKFLTFVISGHLEITQQDVQDDSQVYLYTTRLGELLGIMSVLTGDPSQVTVTAIKRSIILTVSRSDVFRLIGANPATLFRLTQQFSKRVSLFLRKMDYALGWTSIEAGHALYRQGEPSHSTYIVLSGRLRSVFDHDDGKKELVSEFGRGDTIGVIEFATGSTRTMTVLAVRDTELGKIPEGLLNTIKLIHPKTVSRLISLLGHQILGQYKRKNGGHSSLSMSQPQRVAPNTNLSTVALIPCSRHVPLDAFSAALCTALNTIGPCKRLTSSLILKQLGSDALNSVYECQLTNHLNSIEDQNRIVLYQADLAMTPWTHQCIRQADVILIIANASENPEECGPIEISLNSMTSVRAQKELILLHPDHTREPTNTVSWLNARGWVSSHLHVRCPEYLLSNELPIHPEDFNPHSDMARVARRLTGTSIGVVLGGGGARGIAHVGILQALQDHGIPVDMIGGTSIGALMGALYADEADMEDMRTRAATFSSSMSRLWNKIVDLTYPYTSMFSGYRFNTGLYDALGDKLIEDLWLPYFCVTTDLTSSEARIHTQGCLWRYVRASMTLSGYLPPLCDPVDGHLLVDGGYVNNLPADVMLTKMGAQTVVAVDVGGQSDNVFDNFGDGLSGWWILWNRYMPFGKTLKIPNMAEIQSRLAYVSCERQLAQVAGMENCYYMRPPIDRFATLQFGAFDDIEETGYVYGTDVVSAWVKGGIVISEMLSEHTHGINKVATHAKSFISYESEDESSRGNQKRMPSPYASFTDIAALVSRIDPPSPEPPQPRRQLSWPSGAFGGVDYESSGDETSSSDGQEIGDISFFRSEAGFYSDGDIPLETTLTQEVQEPMESQEIAGSV